MATTQQRKHDSLMWLKWYSVHALDSGEKICFNEYVGWRSAKIIPPRKIPAISYGIDPTPPTLSHTCWVMLTVEVDIGGGWQSGSWHSHWSICTQIGWPLACVVRYIILCCIAPSFAFWGVKTSKYKENTHNMCTYCLTRTVFSGAVPRIEIAISRTRGEKQDEVPEETKRYQLPRHDCNSTGKA